MYKLYIIIVVWIVIFAFRVIQNGGLKSSPSEDVTILEDLKANLSQNFSDLMPEQQAGLLSGILLGDGSKIPYDLDSTFRKTTTIHMVVVSGQNLTMLAGFLMGLVYLIGRRRPLSYIVF